jgi:hypothetical protein
MERKWKNLNQYPKKTPAAAKSASPKKTAPAPVKPKAQKKPSVPKTPAPEASPEPFALTPPSEKAPEKKALGPTVRLNVEVPEDLQDRLKIHAIKTKSTVKEIVQAVLEKNIPRYDG